jgi:ParB family chromosome partitioning protein
VALKHGLGKGLDALFPPDEFDGETDPKEGETPGNNHQPDHAESETAAGSWEMFLSLDKLKPNPSQPRKNFDEEELKELADSIREHGIIEPVIAEEDGEGGYIVVAGERRCRAARLAGLSRVPAILRSYSDEKRMEVALVENIHRADLNPIEEAMAYKQLMESAGLSQDEVSARVGRNRSTVANALRLLRLPGPVREGIERGELTAGHARAILSVTGEKKQEDFYGEIVNRNLSVRDAEKRAAELNTEEKTGKAGGAGKPAGASPEKAGTKGRIPELNAMEEKFIGRLGTKVTIDGDMNRGRIRIDYYSMEDLERLYEILGG